MIIYYVLGVYDDDKKTIKSCIEVNKLIIAMIKNEETKADRLINSFPTRHPVSEIYRELRNIDNDCLKNVEDDEDVEKLSNQIAK